MTKLIKNLKPYRLTILLLLVVLVIQAFGDISIPSYMQKMIDTGVQNKGIEQGTHDALIAEGGAYADLYNSQFDEVEAP